jgi:hypothetical protein
MTPAEFKKKWSKFAGKESSGYQSHFDDLCRLLKVPTPLEADPDAEFFCFQKRVVKDAELFAVAESGEEAGPDERGFADVWKRGCFAWEYKGKRKNLDEAYKQLLRYREALENPPLLVVCDFDRYVVKTNFNGTVQEVFEFTNDTLDRPENLRVLRALFGDPDSLRPQRTTAQVTETLAATIAEVAKSLHQRESVELTDAKTRKELNFAARKNLRIARFLNRIVFCFFAEDTGLLPRNLFSDLLKTAVADPQHFATTLETLFGVMAKGGSFGKDKIRHFNGHLFEDATVFELNEAELTALAEAGDADWQFIEPSIMGTLFERALEPEQRSQLGAHYTSETDIKTLVEPVLMAPLRREWAELRSRQRKEADQTEANRGSASSRRRLREELEGFQRKLAATTVLDPACGSGNFLYVSLQLLLGLEKEVLAYATQLGFTLRPQVSVQQLRALEINPYAYELAQVSVQIGFLQWRRDNGFDNDRSPVLQNLEGFENKDALLREVFKRQPKDLKEAQAEEHAHDGSTKGYVEREWPACEVIVGNPPFLGGKMLRRELGDSYVETLFEIYGSRVRPEADLCCYWFEKARERVESKKCQRAGLLATQGIRGGANRDTLQRIKQSGDIFFAESDRDWILAGAAVHVSMVGFDDGTETVRHLDGRAVAEINANLSSAADITTARPLKANTGLVFMGDTKGGAFDLPELDALALMDEPNPHGCPNSDVLVPWANGFDVTRRSRDMWIVDFGPVRKEAEAAAYAAPFHRIQKLVEPFRAGNKRETYRRFWWRHVETRTGMLAALAPMPRFLATVRVAKHRLFAWLNAPLLPDCQLFAFARWDDYFFGVVHARLHEVWARAHGTQVRERESGFRYTPTTCFETFPFPFPDDLVSPPRFAPDPPKPPVHPGLTPEKAYADAAHFFSAKEDAPAYFTAPQSPADHRAAIAAAAKELNELRERWLNPPEWTETRTLEFPGSVSGPWARYVDPATVNAQTGVGTVSYPRLEPKDAEHAAKLKKRTLTNLYNERPTWLANAHQTLDAAVAAAYGWVRDGQPETDLTDEQILERLLALNLERAAEEAKSAQTTKPAKKTQREKSADEFV